MTSASEIVSLLNLEPHIEGGFYRQTFADGPDAAGRPLSTLIYYMLTARQSGAWHKVDAAEVWHFYAGAPMRIDISRDGRKLVSYPLGIDLAGGERPQVVIPPGAWQRASTTGDWTLVGCTVAPGFQFSKFERAPEGWQPG